MLTFPHNFVPMDHHLVALRNRARFKVMCWHRKARKTTLAVNELMRRAAAEVGVYWYVAPVLKQARAIVWQEPDMFPRFCPPEIWAKRNNTNLTIPMPNGSIIQVCGADDPDSMRGPNPKGVVLDEYGKMKKAMWSSVVQPIMMANKTAWTWFMGTPNGKNDFYVRLQHALNSGDPAWWGSILKASESGIIDPVMLEEAKRTTTQAYYGQEYECDFIDSAQSFFRRVRDNTYDATDEKLWNILSGQQFKLGIDLAKYQDWTVITPLNLHTLRVGPQDRFNQVDWNLQKARVEAAYLRHNKAKITIDSTGLGDPIVDDLRNRGVEIDLDGGHAFKFTETSRANLLSHLSMLLEQDRIKLPNDPGLIDELEAMHFELGPTGKIRAAVPEGMHDDRIMSLALACFGVETRLPYTPEGTGIVLQRRAENENVGFN